MNKRAQITIFIILGILLLAISSLVFYIREKSTIYNPGIISKEQAKNIPDYIQSCLHQVGSGAITKLELQGGYLYLDSRMEDDPKSYITYGAFQIPYWYYNNENRMPPNKKFLELQLNRYIKENIDLCLEEFAPFQNQYDFEYPKNKTVTTRISDSIVQIEFNYPLIVKDKTGEKPTEIGVISTKVQSRLGKLFKLSTAIMLQENTRYSGKRSPINIPYEGNFLELITDEIISTSGFPYEGFTFKCGEEYWKKSEIKPDLFQMLKNNLVYLSFSATDNVRFQENYSSYYDNIYNIQLQTTNEAFPGVYVRTVMEESFPGYELDITPSSGDIVKPIDPDMPLVGYCFKMYHHKWNVKYPLLLQAVDKYSGETFNFPTIVEVKRNEPARTMSKETFLPDNTEELTITRQDFCESAKYPVRIYTRDSRRTNIGVDGYIDNASVKYQCLRFACELGMTSEEYDDMGNALGGFPVLSTQVPFCQNGAVIAKKEGYIQGESFITTDTQEEKSVHIEMLALKPFNFTFNIYEYKENDDKSSNLERSIMGDETVIISIKYQNISYATDTFYTTKDPLRVEPLKMILKANAKMTIDVNIVSGNNVIGGYYRENVTLSLQQLDKGQRLVIPIIVKNPGPTPDEYAQMRDELILVQSQKYSIKIE